MRVIRALTVRRWSSVTLASGVFVAALGGVWIGTSRSHEGSSTPAIPPRAAGTKALAGTGASSPETAASRETAELYAAWRSVVARPDSPVRNAELARLLDRLASVAPERAITLAMAETNLVLRQSLIAVALRGWAGTDANAAADWALLRPLAERGAELGAVLAGAAVNPNAAIALAQRLIPSDPALAHDHGCSLLFALADRGAFSDAAHFASAAPADRREAWLDVAFTAWAEHQPRAAATAAAGLPPTEREPVMRIVLSRWSAIDPPAAAEFALTLDSASERRFGVGSALAAWATQDLAAASAWLNGREPTSDFDAGVAAVATSPALTEFRPLVAIDWAESIFAPEVRAQALTAIVQQWAKRDASAAMAYVLHTPALSAADRSVLRTSLKLLAGSHEVDAEAGESP